MDFPSQPKSLEKKDRIWSNSKFKWDVFLKMFKLSWFIRVKTWFPAVFLWPKISVHISRRCAIFWQPCPMVLWQPSTKPTCGCRLKARWAKHFWCWRRRKRSKRRGLGGGYVHRCVGCWSGEISPKFPPAWLGGWDPSGCKWWSDHPHLEGVPQPQLIRGQKRSPYDYEPRIRPSWDDPPSTRGPIATRNFASELRRTSLLFKNSLSQSSYILLMEEIPNNHLAYIKTL